jgi:hypothetical protein
MRRLLIGGIILIAMLVGTIIAEIYFTEASISYKLDRYFYKKKDNQWYSVLDLDDEPLLKGTFSGFHVVNNGVFDGTFNITIKLAGASFLNGSLEDADAKITNQSEAVFSFTLKPQQEIDRTFYFNVTAESFAISIDLQSDQFFFRSTEANWGHQNAFYYAKYDNITWVPSQIAG